VGSVEADDERQIAVADDWQLQRLAHSSLTDTAAPCPGDIGGPSEQAYTRSAPGRPAKNTLGRPYFTVSTPTTFVTSSVIVS